MQVTRKDPKIKSGIKEETMNNRQETWRRAGMAARGMQSGPHTKTQNPKKTKAKLGTWFPRAHMSPRSVLHLHVSVCLSADTS